LFYVEGPEAYSPTDVAAAFAEALKRPVEVDVAPREHWLQTFESMGFSPSAARSYANMTAVTVERCERPKKPIAAQSRCMAT
jgi:hypothetical protein